MAWARLIGAAFDRDSYVRRDGIDEWNHTMKKVRPAEPTRVADDDLPAAILNAVAAGAPETFEARIRDAIDDLPAHFLFHMRIDLAPAMDVAAIVTTGTEAADFLIVRQTEGEELTIEAATESDLPIAALIPAYAGLAATLPTAIR